MSFFLFVAVAGLLPNDLPDDVPPNVVLIVSDDQAWTDYGFMGHPVIETPHLDRLATESVTYPHGYVPDSLCRPSLVTIMTGLYPHQHGVVGNDPPPPEDLAGLRKKAQREDPRYLQRRIDYLSHIDQVDTLAEMLGRRGYLSHQSGKWWEGSYQRGGFTHGMTHGDQTRGGRHGDKGLTIGRKGIQAVTDFLDTAKEEGKPFFVYYAPFLPHSPHNPPERLLKKYRGKKVGGKPTPLPVAKYYAMCEWFDETCGQVLDAVDERGFTDNTVVLYVCDNGWVTRPQNGGYDERSKRSQYDFGTRTPIMVKAPGATPRTDLTPVNSVDLVPTALAAVGAEVPDGLPGIDLLNADAVRARQAVFGEIFEHDIRHMTDPVPSLRFRWVISGGWKLIVPHQAVERNAKPELFRLALDPFEKQDLASAEPGRVKELTAMLDQWWTP